MKKNATWYLPYTINFLEACTSAMFVHFEPESSGSSKSVHTAHVCFGKNYVIVLYPARCFHPLNFIPALSYMDFSSSYFSSLHFHPPNFSSLYIPIWQGPTQCCEWFFPRIRIYLVFLCTFSVLSWTYLPIKRKGAFYTIPI